MQLFLLNIQWMAFNSSLAVIGMVLGWLALKSPGHLRFVFAALWFLFIPNTIYMVTDIAHLSWQLPGVDPVMYLPIIVQFLLLATLGVVTFVLGFYPFEQLLHSFNLPAQAGKKKHADYALFIILIMNILIGVGVMLGRVYRLHSWYVVTQPGRVAASVLDFITSVELIATAVVFGTVGFIVYLLLRDDAIHFAPKKLRKI